jgi:hypothetical protein
MTDATLANWLRELLKPLGFKRRGSAWVRECPDVTQVVDLQKSNFGGRYYVNLGLALSTLGVPQPLREELCHVRVRAEALFRDTEALGKLLDSDEPIPPESRIARLHEEVSPVLERFIEMSCHLDGLRSRYVTSILARGFVHRLARPILEIQRVV